MQTSVRSQKMASVIERELMPIIQRYLTPNQIGFLTITKIEVSTDLRIADIFVSSIGGPKGFETRLAGLSKKISHELSKHLHIQRRVTLRFELDVLSGLPTPTTEK